MSALVEQPSHFLDWLSAEGVAESDRMFVTRDRYGQYLQSLLREATAEAGPGRLILEHDGVVAIEPAGDRWSLNLAMGRTLMADAVVLALGNLPPSPPDGLDEALLCSPRYVGDPWAWSGPVALDGSEVLLVGTGLTAIDVALTIYDAMPAVRMVAMSRHGLLPRTHGDVLTAAAARPAAGTPADLLSEVRRRATADWRGTVDALRPHVQTIWRGWDVAQRRRFLRHLRPWWNVHRHRLAPEVAKRIDDFRESGQLTILTGRIQSMVLRPEGVDVTWTPRGDDAPRVRRVAQVVNCTGPRGELDGSEDSLIGGLMASGLVRPDACRLGVDVDARSRMIGASGHPTESLFAVGPLTRGQFYEITSVPDIRLQAADCADFDPEHAGGKRPDRRRRRRADGQRRALGGGSRQLHRRGDRRTRRGTRFTEVRPPHPQRLGAARPPSGARRDRLVAGRKARQVWPLNSGERRKPRSTPR